MMRTAVITSKKAREHYQKIVAEHKKILADIERQSINMKSVQGYSEQKREKDEMTRIQREKEERIFGQKDKELELKKLALTSQ